MTIFEFSTEVITKIVAELSDAHEFIKIAIFQLHNGKIFQVLNNKLQEGIEVEIFTLPYDSINEDVRDEVTVFFKNLEKKGAKLHFCRWNVGDPFRTTTAVGRWYSFHGKFIVTDKSAIALSANFTQSQELDATIIYRNENNKIEEFNRRFDELVILFTTENEGYNGIIRKKIMDTNLPNIEQVFSLPSGIQTEIHKNHWIQHYPAQLCSENTMIEDRLYVSPFKCRARDFLMALISQASEFVYISTESFTDPGFSKFLASMRLSGLDIKILSGATSMDFQDRMQRMLRELLAYEIDLRTTELSLHAKIIITDKHVVVSSVNLNNMNLGFYQTKRFWRANTETITVCSDLEVRKEAKKQYLGIFGKSNNVIKKLAKKNEDLINDILFSKFGLRSKREVKSLFAQLVVKAEIEVKKFAIKIGKITAKLMNVSKRKTVQKNDFLSALILYYLSERKHDYNDLAEKLNTLETEVELNLLLSKLINYSLIEKTGDFYKIKVDTLLKQ